MIPRLHKVERDLFLAYFGFLWAAWFLAGAQSGARRAHRKLSHVQLQRDDLADQVIKLKGDLDGALDHISATQGSSLDTQGSDPAIQG
jgi:hypothetical protein